MRLGPFGQPILEDRPLATNLFGITFGNSWQINASNPWVRPDLKGKRIRHSTFDTHPALENPRRELNENPRPAPWPGKTQKNKKWKLLKTLRLCIEFGFRGFRKEKKHTHTQTKKRFQFFTDFWTNFGFKWKEIAQNNSEGTKIAFGTVFGDAFLAKTLPQRPRPKP